MRKNISPCKLHELISCNYFKQVTMSWIKPIIITKTSVNTNIRIAFPIHDKVFPTLDNIFLQFIWTTS